MMNKKMITLIGVAALMASIVTMNTQIASASTPYAEGSNEGKEEGHSDAINGRAANDPMWIIYMSIVLHSLIKYKF